MSTTWHWVYELSQFGPFLTSQYLYWIVWAHHSLDTTAVGLFTKCFPVLALLFYVLNNEWPRAKRPFLLRIAAGLAVSCVADAVIQHEELFLAGVGLFGVAQFSYILAFGFERRRPLLAVPLLVFGASVLSKVIPSVDDVVLKVALLLYGALLLVMAWRALAFSTSNAGFLTGVGGVLFMVSDSFIALDKFHRPMENPRLYIMSTYYAAQFLITLSCVEIFVSAAAKKIEREKEREKEVERSGESLNVKGRTKRAKKSK